jgi:enoyl-CoA hydratase/carnithine racemase
LLHTILDFPFPTICLITGHVFGGACLLTLAHDYRFMNSHRGYWCMPPVNLGLHFDGMGALPRLKLSPAVARSVLLEAKRFTGMQALDAGIVDAVAGPGMEEMLAKAVEWAENVKGRGKMRVFGVLRGELWGETAGMFQKVSYVHSKATSRKARVKL